MRIFNREPALVLQAISAALSLLVTFQFGIDADQAGAWVALITAIFAAITAWITRPMAPAVFTGLVGAVVALLAAYGFETSAEAVAGWNAFTLAVFALLTRVQVTPAPPGPVA